MSQTELADRVGLTFQQIQKYESGANRVGAGRLMEIAAALKAPIRAFFEGVELKDATNTRSPVDLIADSQALRLVRAFAEIDDSQLKRSLVSVVELIANEQQSSSSN